MMDSENDRDPLPPAFKPYIPATILLARLGEATAGQDLSQLETHRDKRVRAKTVQRQRPRRLLHDHGPGPQQNLGASLQRVLALLDDPTWEVREEALRWILDWPDERVIPALAERLSDASAPLQEVAARAVRRCATQADEYLSSLYPKLEFIRPPLPIPPTATPDEQAQIEAKNLEHQRWDYEVRRNSIKALHYPHASVATQDRLLAVFDQPQLQTKRELSGAFRYCPDRPRLQAAMLERLEHPNPVQAASALFVLAGLENTELRPTFVRFLSHPDPAFAQAAVLGLAPLAQPGDVPALQQCRDTWKTGLDPL